MPFALTLGALAPWLVSLYHDEVGQYDGALLVVAALNVLSGVLIFLAPPPRRKAVVSASATPPRDAGGVGVVTTTEHVEV